MTRTALVEDLGVALLFALAVVVGSAWTIVLFVRSREVGRRILARLSSGRSRSARLITRVET